MNEICWLFLWEELALSQSQDLGNWPRMNLWILSVSCETPFLVSSKTDRHWVSFQFWEAPGHTSRAGLWHESVARLWLLLRAIRPRWRRSPTPHNIGTKTIPVGDTPQNGSPSLFPSRPLLFVFFFLALEPSKIYFIRPPDYDLSSHFLSSFVSTRKCNLLAIKIDNGAVRCAWQ